jgi:hypothetical protein
VGLSKEKKRIDVYDFRRAPRVPAPRYELRMKEREMRKKAVTRRKHDQIKELRLSAGLYKLNPVYP